MATRPQVVGVSALEEEKGLPRCADAASAHRVEDLDALAFEEDEDHEPVAAVAHWEDEDGCQKERSCDVALRPVRKWERGGGRGLARVGGTGGWGTAHLLRKNWTARLSSLTPYAACSSGG